MAVVGNRWGPGLGCQQGRQEGPDCALALVLFFPVQAGLAGTSSPSWPRGLSANAISDMAPTVEGQQHQCCREKRVSSSLASVGLGTVA